MVATTRIGSSSLGLRGWTTVRHARTDIWPIAYDWLGATDYLFPLAGEAAAPAFQPAAAAPASPTASDCFLDETAESEFEFSSFLNQTQRSGDSAAAAGQSRPTRRIKTLSECTDTSLSQNMVEIGPPPIEPNFPLPGRLTEKISSWFSATTRSEGRSEPKLTGIGRRYSEGGKPGSSLTSKLRSSFNRKRSKTISTGKSRRLNK